MPREVNLLAQVDASPWLRDESPTWEYCNDWAPWAHREACEFMFHLAAEDDAFDDWKKTALEGGCHPDLVQAIDDARRLGARYVIVYT